MSPVTLAQAALNTQEDLDGAIIDEFRKQSATLDVMIFDQAVNPMGGGSTLTYGYHRHITERGANFREINTEYQRQSAAKQRFSVELRPLGGKFGIDRVLAQVALGAEVTYQMRQVIKASSARFNDALINGDTADSSSDAEHGFDGLDKALTGSSTEIGVGGSVEQGTLDWSELDSNGGTWHGVLDVLDFWWSHMDGMPSVVWANSEALAKLRAVARRANQYVQRPVEGLTDGSGAPIVRGYWGNTLLLDAGEVAGSANKIIPVVNGVTDLYGARIAMDGFHAVAVAGQPLVQFWMPDFTTAGAVKDGEVEMGPLATTLKATKAASVLRNVKVRGGS
jgi:hypothetical protein